MYDYLLSSIHLHHVFINYIVIKYMIAALQSNDFSLTENISRIPTHIRLF